jgi:hypothetical protein
MESQLGAHKACTEIIMLVIILITRIYQHTQQTMSFEQDVVLYGCLWLSFWHLPYAIFRSMRGKCGNTGEFVYVRHSIKWIGLCFTSVFKPNKFHGCMRVFTRKKKIIIMSFLKIFCGEWLWKIIFLLNVKDIQASWNLLVFFFTSFCFRNLRKLVATASYKKIFLKNFSFNYHYSLFFCQHFFHKFN